jgi:hypothetical protein
MIDLDDGFIDMHGTAGSVELTEAQFNQAKTDRGEYPDCADYREYQTKYCNGKYEIPNSNYSRIRMDTISPYFRIHSAA